jgi:hypothetical protein
MMRAVRNLVACAIVPVGVLLVAVEARGGTTGDEARAVLKTYCYRCHGQDGRNEGGLNFVTDLGKLVASKRVVPGEPDRSKLLQRIVGGDMPPDVDFEDRAEEPPPLPRPGPREVAALRDWIKAGATVSAPGAERPFLADLEMLRLIADDVRRIAPRERRFARYFTITHLANAGDNEDQLQTYRHGLSKLINSLSWSRRVKAPAPVDPGGTILRIDLRDYLWDDGTWRAILGRYPYGLRFEGPLWASVVEMTSCDLPYVRADWFVYAASRPPLYHEVLRLPETVEDLERKLDVDVAADIRQDRVARAAFNASGVSRNNRLIERHESTNGGYWRSYDFAGNADRKNLFSHPLGPGDGPHDFQYDGGEIIFALPNGLNGYMLIDASGGRIDKGPTEIVRDNKQSDGAVVNGISCMSCHNRGLIEKADEVRAVVMRTKAFGKEETEDIMALYPPRERMEELMRGDLDRFARAVKETGASLSRTEPVFALATQFEQEVGMALASAEAGQKAKEFQSLVSRTPALGQALGPLLVGGAVKRDVYLDAFPLIAEARHLKMLDAIDPPPAVAGASAPSPERTSPGARGAATKPGTPGRNAMTRPGVPPDARVAMARPGMPTRAPSLGGRKDYPPDRLVELPANFFGGDRDRFGEVGPTGTVLVGVRVSYHEVFGGPKISSVQPLYRSGSGSTLVEGERHGTLNGPETTAVAKRGYAVGALRTHTGLGVDGFEVVFMRIKGDRLDPSDSYNSPWLGDVKGGSPRDVLNDGSLVVGLQGRASKSVNALGLIVVK